MCSSTVTLSSRPAAALSLKAARHEAAVLYAEDQAAMRRVGYLGQKANLQRERLRQLNAQIANSKAIVAAETQKVNGYQAELTTAAINAFVNNGAAAAENPLFSGDEAKVGAANVYRRLAEGNLGSAVASLRNSTLVLTQQRQILRNAISQAAQATRAANQAFSLSQQIQRNIRFKLDGVSGVIANYLARIRQIEAARAAAAAAAALSGSCHHHRHRGCAGYGSGSGSNSGFSIPGTSPRAYLAVQAALRMLGVPYVWGGASRYGVDCSGLVMLAWSAAGVGLPHYSGAQFNDTYRIPLWALKPGDLLFYGYHGNEHESMYIGHGMMIEAPYTGTYVRITPVRFDYGFAGAGRVR